MRSRILAAVTAHIAVCVLLMSPTSFAVDTNTSGSLLPGPIPTPTGVITTTVTTDTTTITSTFQIVTSDANRWHVKPDAIGDQPIRVVQFTCGDVLQLSVIGAGDKPVNLVTFPPSPNFRSYEQGHQAVYGSRFPTNTVLFASVTGDDGKQTLVDQLLMVALTGTGPGPLPPGPTPTPPKPDDVVVDPIDVAPVKTEGYRVFMYYDADKGAPTALASTAVTGYLTSATVKSLDGKTPGWRRWDQTVEPEGDDPVWADFKAVAKKDSDAYFAEHTEALKEKDKDGDLIPFGWVVISNGKTGYSGRPPTTIEDMLALCKKHGPK